MCCLEKSDESLIFPDRCPIVLDLKGLPECFPTRSGYTGPTFRVPDLRGTLNTKKHLLALPLYTVNPMGIYICTFLCEDKFGSGI